MKHGLKVKMVPEEYVAESVVKGLRDKVNGKRVVLIRAKVARDVIPEELRSAGAASRCDRSLRNRGARKIACAPARVDEKCSSPSAHCDLHQFLHREELCRIVGQLQGRVTQAQVCSRHVQFASIGPVTSATLRELHMPVAIEAREFTMGGLIRAIVLARYAETSQ